MHEQLDVGPRQLAERRADRALAGRRDERERVAFGLRIRLVAIEPHRRRRIECGGEEIDFSVRRVREDVHELHRRRSTRGRRHRAVAQVGADRLRQTVQHGEHEIELAGRLIALQQTETRAQIAEHVSVRPCFADGVDDRASEVEADRTVAFREIVAFEERRVRQQHVGVQRRVRHHLLEDHGEQILAFEAFEHAPLIGHGHRRIAVVDEQHVDRRVVVLGQRAAEMVHVHDARVRLGRVDPRAVDVPRRRVAHRVAAAADAELAADGRQREH